MMQQRMFPCNVAGMPSSAALRKRCQALGLFLALLVATCVLADGMKDFDNRREGTNVHPNALEDFTLLGVHRNFESFPKNANLHVRFFLPQLPGNPKREVSVEAAEIQDSFHYFMQSKASIQWKDGNWNIFEPWPTKDVIDGLGIQADNLGVLVKYQIANKLPVYLPADVYQNKGQSGKHTYTFHLLTGQDLQSLEISVTNIAGTEMKLPKLELKCPRNLHPNCKLYAAGDTLAFDLDMSPLSEGEYYLKLVGHAPRTSTQTSLDIALYHRPNWSDGH